MQKLRAGRNKTIALTEDEIDSYYTRCIVDTPGYNYHGIADAVICGDTFGVLERLPEGCANLLIVDPPYNMNKTFGSSHFKQVSGEEYASFTEAWIAGVKRALHQTASIYVCCDWRSSLTIGTILLKHFYVQNRITWQREKGRGAGRNWKNAMEDIWFATVSPKQYTFNADKVKIRRKVIAPYRADGKPKDWVESEDGNFRDTCPSNFWDDISIPYWSMPENTDHPTQKPEKLIAKLILAGSNPGDLVLDPFLGSGTTAAVAKKLDRRYIGIEKEREYCAIAQRRLELAGTDTKIQGYVDGVFWERNTGAMQRKLKSKKK